ncbi:hypothetical protein [Streptomyces canus]|uniref:hypothetical protein n=1 Tax=Streptomyces canus TaxID=58343 RepID=UPI000366177F|nr:hypothetical protein [Streptomyces canus]
MPDGEAKPTGGLFFLHLNANSGYTSMYEAPSLTDMRVGQLRAPVPAVSAATPSSSPTCPEACVHCAIRMP